MCSIRKNHRLLNFQFFFRPSRVKFVSSTVKLTATWATWSHTWFESRNLIRQQSWRYVFINSVPYRLLSSIRANDSFPVLDFDEGNFQSCICPSWPFKRYGCVGQLSNWRSRRRHQLSWNNQTHVHHAIKSEAVSLITYYKAMRIAGRRFQRLAANHGL